MDKESATLQLLVSQICERKVSSYHISSLIYLPRHGSSIKPNVTAKHIRQMTTETLLTDERKLRNYAACSNVLLLNLHGDIQMIKFNHWFIFK